MAISTIVAITFAPALIPPAPIEEPAGISPPPAALTSNVQDQSVVSPPPPIEASLEKTLPPVPPVVLTCVDDDAQCSAWASTNQCEENPAYMDVHCKKSCGICCSDDNEQCASWAEMNQCVENPSYMDVNCRKSCGKCSDAPIYHRMNGSCRSSAPSKTIGTSGEVTQAECEARCSADHRCQAYEYGLECDHYDQEVQHVDQLLGPATTCVVKQTDGRPYNRFYGQCAVGLNPRKEGAYVLHTDVTRDYCKSMCTDDKECTAYQWSTKHNNCKLQHSEIHFVYTDADTKKYDSTCVVKF